ncbi:MAG: alcohol dehydrogenase [Planctomycetota bacterium]|nr:MAG: alcohol dehydrogenase [Planctomycetota bacterium]
MLEIRDVPKPSPKDNEVLIEVKAAGINFADIMARMGLYVDSPPLPCVVGYEVSGVVRECGKEVKNLKEGDSVAALTHFGGYSEWVVVPEKQAVKISEKISFASAAAVPVNYLTAWLMLIRLGNLQPEETVLVHAAAGGVGLAALQICLYKKAKVIGTASQPKHERLKKMGVCHTIDYRNQDFAKEVMDFTEGRGVDIVLDAQGGKSFHKSYQVLAPMGRLYLFGASSTSSGRKKRSILQVLKTLFWMPKFKAVDLMLKNKGVMGVNLGRLWHRGQELEEILKEIFQKVEQGIFQPVVDKIFSFEEASQAHEYIQNRQNFGKVILSPDKDSLKE